MSADARLTVVERDPTGQYGRYDVELGKGAYKTVYKGFDKKNAIEVAWNKLSLSRLSEAELSKVSQEVELLRGLKHKNIIACFASWETTNKSGHKTIHFITELVMSGSLKEYLQRSEGVQLKVVRRWCLNILEAISYLHSRDPPIMHRDIKCDNIFINGHVGEVKIGDLGLSGIRKTDKANTVIGTPEFMAPELYEEEYTEKVDVYAFGMCVLEMITMEYPYSECQNPAQIFKKVFSGTPPRALEKISDGDFKNVIRRCLKKEKDRPSAADLLEDPLFRDWEKDESGRENVDLLLGENSIANGVGESLDETTGENGPVYHHAEVLNRDVLMTVPSSSQSVEPSLLPPVEQGEVRISVHIPIDGTIKKIEFGYDPTSDSAAQLADELVEEFQLDPDLHVEAIRNEIEGQVRMRKSNIGNGKPAANGTSHQANGIVSPSNSVSPTSSKAQSSTTSKAQSQTASASESEAPSPEKQSSQSGRMVRRSSESGSADGPPQVVVVRTESSSKSAPASKGDQGEIIRRDSIPLSNGSLRMMMNEHGSAKQPNGKKPFNQKSFAENMALLDYSAKGRAEKVRQKLTAGVPATYADYDKRTALHLAATEGHVEVVRLLLDFGAEVDAADRWGATPIQDAKKNGRKEVLEVFRESGALGEEDEEEEDGVGGPDVMAGRELLEFCYRGDLEMVKERVVAGANVNYADYDQRTPLHLAASEGNTEVAEFLLLNGADFSLRDRYGRTPVEDARKNGHRDLLSVLERYGARSSAALIAGPNPDVGLTLIAEASKGNAEAVVRLLQGGASAKYSDYDKRTPLHLAVGEGHLDIVRTLLSRGADPLACDRFGNSPIDEAAKNGNGEIRKALETAVKAMADTKSNNMSGTTTPSVRDPSPLGSPPGSVLMTPPPTPLDGVEDKKKVENLAAEAALVLDQSETDKTAA